jgi:YD repeat-containing protein
MYRLPFHLMSSQGLGYRYSSLSQIGDLVPQVSVGQAQVEIYVNANGNVVVEDPVSPVVDGGHALPLQLVYNSQAASAAKAWRFAAHKRLRQTQDGAAVVLTEACGHETVYRERQSWFADQSDERGCLLWDEMSDTFEWRLPGASEGLRFDAKGRWQTPSSASVTQAYGAWSGAQVHCAGEQVVLRQADGSSRTFTRRGYWYMAPSHGAGTARLYYDEEAQTWEWVDPASGGRERYDTTGLRVEWFDREGHSWRLAQESQAGETRWVLTGDSGLRYVWQRQVDADEFSLRCYTLSEEGEDEHSQVLRRYYLDEKGLLRRSVFADGYALSYDYGGYGGRDWLLSGLAQSDGTRLALKYQVGGSGQPQVREVTLGDRQEAPSEVVRWFVDYGGDGRVKVTDNQWYVLLQLDEQNNVRSFTQSTDFAHDKAETAQVGSANGLPPATAFTGQRQGFDETTFYRYTRPVHGAGQIESIQFPNGGEERFTYDAFSGLVTCHTGAEGQETRSYYQLGGARAETLVSEAREVDGQSLLTQYVYDYDYRAGFTFLRFALSPQGRVTEYEPRDNGHEVIERVYLSQAYPHKTDPGFPPLLGQLTDWVLAQRQAGHPVSVRVQHFDARFQLRDTLAYAEVDAECGRGIESAGMQATRTLCGRAGEVRARWQLLGYQPDDTRKEGADQEVKSDGWLAASVDEDFIRVSPAGALSSSKGGNVPRKASSEEDFVWVSDEDETVSDTPQALRPEPLPAPGRYAHAQWTYDGLQRERSHCDALGACTQYTYEDAKQAFMVRYPNAREARHTWDSKGLEVSETHTVGGQSSPQTRDWRHRFRPLTGDKVETVGPEGYPVYTFYDGMGREVLTIEVSAWSRAQVTRTLRDTAHRWTQTLAFAKPLDLSRYQERFERGMFPGTDVMLMEIDAQGLGADPQDQRRYQVLDRSDRLRYEVVDGADPKLAGETPAWYVTEQVYDALDRPVRTIAYAEPLSESEHSALLAGDDLSRVADPQVDRVEQTFYTAEGLVLAEQDAAGYVTRYAHDVGGRVWRTTHYTTPSAHTRDLASLFPKPHPDDAYHYVYYDALSRPVLEVDAEGFVTTLRYQADQLHERRRFAHRVSDAWWRLSEPRPRPDAATDDGLSYMPAPSAADECITYTYDEKGRLIEERHNDGTLKVNTYDAMDQLIEQVVQDTQHPLLNDGDHRRAQGWRFDGWGQVTHYANAYVSQAQQAVLDDETLSDAEKAARLAELWETRAERRFYTPCGLLARVEQRVAVASGQWRDRKTLTYYDRRRRPAVTISAGGAVVRYAYHPLHEAAVNVYRYARVLPPEALAPLLGGALADLPQELLDDLGEPSRDRQEVFDFDRRDLQVHRLDEEGHAWRTVWNAFGEAIGEEEPAVQAGQPIHITQERDVRGLVRCHTRAAGDLRLSTHSHHAHRLGLVTESQDALGASTINTYDRLGRLHTVLAAGQSRASERVHDAWGRVLRVENALGQVTGHTYERQRRAHTISHPQADTWTRTEKNIFSEAVRTYTPLDETRVQTLRREHAPDGQVRLEEDGEGELLHRLFNDLGWLLSTVAAEGIETQWHYDASGFVESRIDDVHGRALHTHYRRDAFGQVIQEINPAGVVTDYGYNRQGHEVRRVLDPAAAPAVKRAAGVHSVFERKAQETVPMAELAITSEIDLVRSARPRASFESTTPLTLEVKGEPARLATGADEPLGLLKQRQVNAHGAPVGLTEGDETTPVQYREAYIVDALNRSVAQVVDPQTAEHPEGLALTKRRLLDAKGRSVARFDAKGQVRYDVFDARDNLVYKIDASGAVTERVFDDVDQCRYQRVYHARLAIDELPCPPTLMDVRAALEPSTQDAQTYHYYDGNQRLCVTLTVGHVLADLPAAELLAEVRTARITEYGYDRAGHRTSQRQYAHLWGAVPETVGEWSLTEMEATIHPWRNDKADRCQSWIYDLADRETFHFDSDGSVHRRDYDGRGRLITRWHYAHKMMKVATDFVHETPEALRARLPKSNEDEVTQFFYDVRDKDQSGRATDRDEDGTTSIFNKPTCVISPNGLVHEFVHTPLGDLTENRQYAQTLNPRHSREALRQQLYRLRTVKQEGTRVTRTLWDKGRRTQQVIDATGGAELFVRDALGLLRKHGDREGHVTTFVADGAKRVVDEYQPAAQSFTTQQKADLRLELKALGLTSLHIHKTLDANGNPIQVHYSDGHTQTKTLEHVFDACDRAVVHRVRDVPVDDPSRPVEFAYLPVQYVVQETGSRTDGLGRTFCEQQENGHWQFDLYDGLGRKQFAIATDGAVIGYRHNAFGDVVEKVKYARRLEMSPEELALFKETGVPYAWLQAHLVLDPEHDCRWFYQRDAKGQVIVERKPFIPVYEPRTRRLFAKEQPVVFQTFNVFNHCVERRTPLYPQVSGGPEKIIRTWYNHGGKPLCEIESVQLSVEAPVTYRAKRFWYNAFDERIGRREYQGVLSQLPDWRESIETIDALLADLPDPEGKTRTRRYPRDARGLLMQRVSEQVVRQWVSHSEGPKAPLQAPQMHDLPAQDLAETYTYTSTGRRCKSVDTDGSDTYRYFDGKGRVIADIGAKAEMLDAQGEVQHRRPATLYYYNGFDQRVCERKLALGAPVEVNEHELPALTLSEADEVALFLLDVRGRMSLSELPDGTLTGYTYSLSGRQPVREWVVSKGYAHDKRGVYGDRYYVDETVSRLDKSDRVVSVIRRRDHRLVRAEHQLFDAFGNVVGQLRDTRESPPDSPWQCPIRYHYVGEHVQWLSVGSDGIPTLHLSDACGVETAKVTSAERDLSQTTLAMLPEVLQDARVELEAKVSAPQGVVLERNHTYIDPLPPGKERIEVDFDVSGVDEAGSVHLRWIRQPMPGLTPRCFVWREGDARQEYPVLEDGDGREGVELAHAVTDRYFVELEYLRVESGQIVTGVAGYYASGEVSVLGARQTGARKLVVAHSSSAVVSLCGRTEDLHSVILYRDETPLAEYKVHEDKRVDLSAQASGVYCFKPRYGTQGGVDEALTLPFTLYTPTPSPWPLSRQFHPQPGLQVVHIEGVGIPLTEGEHKGEIGYTFGHFTLWESLPADYRRYPATVTIHYWPKDAGTGPGEQNVSIDVTPGEYLSDFPDDIPGMPQANMVLPEHMGVLVSLSVSLQRGSAVGDRRPLLMYEDEPPVGSGLWPAMGDARGQTAAAACEDKSESPPAAVDASWTVVPEVITYRFAARHRVVIEPLVLGAEASLHFFDKSQGRQAAWVRLANTLSQAGQVVSFDLSGQRPGVYPFSVGEDTVRLSRAQGETFTLLGQDSAGVYASAPAQPVAPRPMEASRRFGWDVWDQLARQESALGVRTDYVRNDEDQLLRVTGPELTLYHNGQPYQTRVVERFGYNLAGDEIGRTDGRGYTKVLLYDASRSVGQILGDGTWSYRQWHNPLGQAVVYEDSAGHRWRTRYERSHPVETLSPEHRATWREFTTGGRLIRHEAPGGLIYTYAHDVDGMVSERRFSDGSWVRTHYDAQRLAVLREYSDGKSMRWQRGDYGYVDESVDLGLNRLHYRRDFKQQVVEETGQLHYPGDKPSFMTYEFVRVWLGLLGYHYMFVGRPISGRRHLTYTYSGGRPIGIYDWERNISSISGYNEDGLRTALQVYQGEQLLRTIRSQLDGLGRMVRSVDDYSVYDTGFDASGNRVLNRAQVGTVRQERHSEFDGARRALMDQGIWQEGRVTLGYGSVAKTFKAGLCESETRLYGNRPVTQWLGHDKERRLTGSLGSLLMQRHYTSAGQLSSLQESTLSYRQNQYWQYMDGGAVEEQRTIRDGRMVNTTRLEGYEQGQPRRQRTQLHTNDNLRYELNLEYAYHGEQSYLNRSSGRVLNNDGARNTTVAQSWRDGNYQLRAQTGVASGVNRRWTFYWVGWPVFSVRAGLARASSWLAEAGGQEKVLLCQLVLADREACWYVCYWKEDGTFGFSELTGQDAGYAVLRALAEVPSRVALWSESALAGVLPRLRSQGIEALTDMHGLPFAVAGLSSGELLSELSFVHWWENWLTHYVSVRSGIFKTQYIYYEQEAGGALLNTYRMTFPLMPAWSVRRQMLFMGVERELLCSITLMFLPMGQMNTSLGEVSLLSRQSETQEGSGAELLARMGAAASGAQGSSAFGFLIQMGLQASSVIKYPYPLRSSDLSKEGRRSAVQVASDLSGGSTTHTVSRGETLKTIAEQYYQDESYAQLLSLMTVGYPVDQALPEGLTLQLPSLTSDTARQHFPGYQAVLSLFERPLVPYMEAPPQAPPPPPPKKKRKCKHKVAQAVTTVVAVTAATALLVPIVGPAAPAVATSHVFAGFLLGAGLNGGLQVAARQLSLLDRFSWEDMLLSGVATGVGAYFRAHGVSELAFKDAAHHLVLAHGATNMTSQLTLLALGQQEELSGRAFMAGMAAGFVSHGMSGAFGSGSEGLVLLLETAVQGQVERLTGALIYQQGIFDLEAIGMSLLGVGVGFATQHMMQALGEHFGWVSASDTQVQESQGHQEEGAPYAPSPEDRVYEEGLLAGQGYASGHEDAGYPYYEGEWNFQDNEWFSSDGKGNVRHHRPSSGSSDERRYTPDWLEERGMRLLPASDSRHGVQAMDGFALETLSVAGVENGWQAQFSSAVESANQALRADTFMDYVETIRDSAARGVWQGMKDTAYAVTHPRETVVGAVHLATDGVYTLTDRAFNVSSSNSRSRRSNYARFWKEFKQEFRSASPLERTGMLTEFGGSLFSPGVGAAVGVVVKGARVGAMASRIGRGAESVSTRLPTLDGLGKLTNREVMISQKGLDIVKNHLSRFGDFSENKLMLQRLENILKGNKSLTGADASFYVHELSEATKMARGFDYTKAHQFALDKYQVSPFSVYHPEVISQLNRIEPGYFNNNWTKFWQEYQANPKTDPIFKPKP